MWPAWTSKRRVSKCPEDILFALWTRRSPVQRLHLHPVGKLARSPIESRTVRLQPVSTKNTQQPPSQKDKGQPSSYSSNYRRYPVHSLDRYWRYPVVCQQGSGPMLRTFWRTETPTHSGPVRSELISNVAVVPKIVVSPKFCSAAQPLGGSRHELRDTLLRLFRDWKPACVDPGPVSFCLRKVGFASQPADGFRILL